MGFALLVLFAVPFGLSVTGCGHKAAPVVYCNASDSGPTEGQVASITLSPTLATDGESLNYGQIGQALSAFATDCKGNAVSVSRYTYATSNMAVADINPSTGQVCAGSWNRNSGGGIADYTLCNAYTTVPSTYEAYVTATASGAVSNAIPVFVHPVVTGIVLGGATASCTTDPGTDCCPIDNSGTPIGAPVYTGTGCVSQNKTGQLIARVYQGGSITPANNITCQVGHISYAPQSSNIVSIDENGVATANQPGSTLVTANLSNSSTGVQAGFFSTCPPKSITLSVPGQTGASSIKVAVNNLQPLTATVLDTNGITLTGLNLEFNSTTPQTIPASVGSVTPTYPGTATITAVCNPGTCNPAPFSQIGLYGNGDPITSNGITITATGTASTEIYMGSTSSQYILPRDFTTNITSSPIKLQYVPNSMVISQDGSTIYMGTPQGLMTLNTATNSQGQVNENVPGTVLAVSPDGANVIITDPTRQTVSLYSPNSSSITTSYGISPNPANPCVYTLSTGATVNEPACATSAKWSPDSQTVYITTNGGMLLVHSSFTSWQQTALNGTDTSYSDVAVMVPHIGAYFAGKNATEGRSYCPSGVISGTTTPQTVTNTFYPLADENTTATDKIAATNDGVHILGATATVNPPKLSDRALTVPVAQPCPQTVTPGYFSSTVTSQVLTGVTATAINGVVPAANSALAFITYTGSGGVLPLYAPSTSGPGTLSLLTLGNGATAASAPVAGVFSTDGLSFYAGTSGDNQVHIFTINGTSATETGVITPRSPPSAAAVPHLSTWSSRSRRSRRARK